MSFATTLRSLLTESFLFLPFVLAGWSFFMGMVQGNVALLVLFLGQAIAVPLLSSTLNKILQFLSKQTGLFNTTAITILDTDVCQLFPTATPGTDFVDAAPTAWLAQVVFFFSFLMSNAAALYSRKEREGADPEKVTRRKTQALFSLILSSLALFALLFIRAFYTGCETLPGALIGATVLGSFGYGWYKLAEACSARDADIFGIVQGIMPQEAQIEPPMTCVYQGTDKSE
jgi:hypothetical protein